MNTPTSFRVVRCIRWGFLLVGIVWTCATFDTNWRKWCRITRSLSCCAKRPHIYILFRGMSASVFSLRRDKGSPTHKRCFDLFVRPVGSRTQYTRMSRVSAWNIVLCCLSSAGQEKGTNHYYYYFFIFFRMYITFAYNIILYLVYGPPDACTFYLLVTSVRPAIR